MSHAAGTPAYQGGADVKPTGASTPPPHTTTTDVAATVVNAGDTAPTNDQWNLVAIELLSDD